MATLNTTQFNSLNEIAFDKFSYHASYRELVDLWNQAVYYNKLQNTFLKDSEPFEVVKSFNLFNEVTKEVEWFNVKAEKAYTRQQWFILLLGASLYTYSIQALRKIMKTV